MNYIFLLFLIANFSLFCADIELTSITISPAHQPTWSPDKKNLDKIISTINTAIDRKYPRNFASSLIQKQEYEYSDIIQTVNTPYPGININDNFIEKLKTKNQNFKDALNYFSTFAKKIWILLRMIHCNTWKIQHNNNASYSSISCRKQSKHTL